MLELSKVVFCKNGGVQFKPWYRRASSDCFGITHEYWNDIDVWYHEFNEEAIWYTLRDKIALSKEYLNSDAMILSLSNGEKDNQLPSHVIVSLQDPSYFKDKLIGPDSYAKMFKWNIKS